MSKIINRIIPYIVIVVIAALVEVFLFNFQHWKTVGYNTQDLSLDDIILETDNLLRKENEIIVSPENCETAFTVPVTGDTSTLGISFKAETEVFEHYFGAKRSITERYRATTNVVSVRVLYFDGGGIQFAETEDEFYLGENNVVSVKPGTSYVTVVLLLDSYLAQKEAYSISKIAVNASIAFRFSWFRYLCVALSGAFLYSLRKKSSLWNIPFSKGKFLCILLPIVLFCIFLLWESKNPFWWSGNCFVDSYGELTKAFANGQVSLDIKPDEALVAMDNPYDYSAREELDVDYLHDYAYYEGKYYVYFGALPALIRLPFYLLTGKMIPYPVLFNGALLLFLIGLAFCLKAYGERYYPKISVPEYTLLYFLWVLLAYSPLIFFAGFNYTLPQIFAAALMTWGLFSYMEAGGRESGVKRRLIAGSFCMALITTCRPQQVLAVLLAIPLLKEKMCKKGTLKLWLSFLLPFVAVAIPVMLYNYVRFGSVTDFGAYYNLTNGNIHEAKLSISTILQAFRYYLLSGWRGAASFPFINLYEPDIAIQNVTVTQLAAGYLITFPIALLPVVYWPRVKGDQKKKESRLLQGVCLVLTIIMICVATFYFSFRYAFDFSVFLGLAVVIASVNLLRKKNGQKLGILLGIIILISAAVSFLVGFTDNIDTLNVYFFNRDFWYKMSHIVTFWTL